MWESVGIFDQRIDYTMESSWLWATSRIIMDSYDVGIARPTCMRP